MWTWFWIHFMFVLIVVQKKEALEMLMVEVIIVAFRLDMILNCLSWLLFIRKKFLKWQSAEVEITITVFQLEIVPKPVALWLQARDVLALGKEYLFFLQLSFLLVLGKYFFNFLVNLGLRFYVFKILTTRKTYMHPGEVWIGSSFGHNEVFGFCKLPSKAHLRDCKSKVSNIYRPFAT